MPESLWSRFDITAKFHKVPQGESPIKRNTPLGSAFSVGLIFAAAAVTIGLYDANVIVAASALVLLKGAAIRTTVRISLDLPLGDPLGDSAPYCADITFNQSSFRGMSCNNGASNISLGKSCEVILTNCTFAGESARLSFDVPWHERYVQYSVSVDSTFESMEHRLSGVVTSGSPSFLIPQEHEVVVAVLAQQALLNDTTNAMLTRDGFELRHLRCVSPKPVRAEGWDLTFPPGVTTPSWQLTIEIEPSQTLYETVRSRKQGPLQLAMAILAAVTSLIGMSQSAFAWVEGPISTLREFCFRTHRQRKERRNSNDDTELQRFPEGRLLLEPAAAKSPESTSKDDVAALQLSIQQLHQQHEQTIQQLRQQHEQYEQTIQQLRQRHERDMSEMQQAIKQLHAAIVPHGGA